ncbi:MAG: transposase [Cellvibrio sp.]|nr:transposase [Cellvibrio sp.]
MGLSVRWGLFGAYQLSDEAVCERWVENPYYQYFCGEEFFQHTFPIQRSSMTHWRKRVGESFLSSYYKKVYALPLYQRH